MFFDPIISSDRNRACASCHPVSGYFTDGGSHPITVNDTIVQRNSLSLVNVHLYENYFWDARVKTLPDATRKPIVSRRELNADPEQLIKRLREIPEYLRKFRASFPESSPSVTLRTVSLALAAYIESLRAVKSDWDRYQNGRETALSEQQIRGMKLFHSLETRCFECHSPPDFKSRSPKNIGVPSPDLGVGLRTDHPYRDGQFRVPTLRNVTLTAPYMHDGSMETLREVIEFYEEGAGLTHGRNPRLISSQIDEFEITDMEITDLISFLSALSDTSVSFTRPSSVPSGLKPAGTGDDSSKSKS